MSSGNTERQQSGAHLCNDLRCRLVAQTVLCSADGRDRGDGDFDSAGDSSRSGPDRQTAAAMALPFPSVADAMVENRCRDQHPVKPRARAAHCLLQEAIHHLVAIGATVRKPRAHAINISPMPLSERWTVSAGLVTRSAPNSIGPSAARRMPYRIRWTETFSIAATASSSCSCSFCKLKRRQKRICHRGYRHRKCASRRRCAPSADPYSLRW